MIIVSDSGPLADLVQIGIADSLPILYEQVFVPPTVMRELCHERSPVSGWATRPPEWVTIAAPTIIPADLLLDEGEREAIAPALERQADILLMDELKGRAAAKALGIRVAGTLAVILDGDSHELFDGLDALVRLESTTFYASSELLQAVQEQLMSLRENPD